MKLKSRLLLFSLCLSLTLFSSCAIVKILSLLNGGEVAESTFNSSVNFERRLGLLIVPVYIEGEQYDFLIDTGAPTVVSSELADKLNLPVLAQQQVSDSQQASERMSFSRIPVMTLGGVEFDNIGVAITDLNASTDITCLEIDGLIGANFLRKAAWKFNYEEETIQFASSLDAFRISAESLIVPLKFTLTKIPVMTVHLGDQVKEKRVAVDLGSNGGFSLATETMQSLHQESEDLNYAVWYGASGGGLYDKDLVDSTYKMTITDVSFGELVLDSTLVSFEEQEMSTVGSAFFEDYEVVISWRKRKMWLSSKALKTPDLSAEYGVRFAYKDGHLVVRKLRVGSDAERFLQLGDQVTAWAGQSYNSLGQQGYCNFLKEKGPKGDSVSIVVERAGKRIEYSLSSVEELE